MSRTDLLALWARLMDGPPAAKISLVMLRQMLGFEVQARRHGGVAAATRQKLARMAKGKSRPTAPKLQGGGRLLREWNGTTHVVEVTAQGYLWRGTTWRSLSAIAREITGAHWSGPRFFGLTGSKAS